MWKTRFVFRENCLVNMATRSTSEKARYSPWSIIILWSWEEIKSNFLFLIFPDLSTAGVQNTVSEKNSQICLFAYEIFVIGYLDSTDWWFTVSHPAQKFFTYMETPVWRHHHYPWRSAKFRPMFGAQGLWAWRDLYRATTAVTRGLAWFSSLIRRTAPFSCLLRHTRGCGQFIITPILTGC
jgi:hypothetical protein